MNVGFELPSIDPRVDHARTLPGWVYGHPGLHEAVVRSVFGRAWSYVAAVDDVRAPGTLLPARWLEGSLDEPLLLSREEGGRLHALSNVCTHRGNLLVTERCTAREIRCGYHGRRFGLSGTLLASPGFEGVPDFPRPQDDLPEATCVELGPVVLASLRAAVPFETWTAPLRALPGALPWDRMLPLREQWRDFEVDASWILYVENYLEGFHVPFVHASLAEALDVAAYRHEMHPWGTLQVGVARPGQAAFAQVSKVGEPVGGYYLWTFPGTMWNVYPWGLSLNVVEPLGPERTRVRFRAFAWEGARPEGGAGGDLERVEAEDEAVVEACQRGLRARLYERGRYAPRHERGVHRFHRLLLEVLAAGWTGADQRA